MSVVKIVVCLAALVFAVANRTLGLSSGRIVGGEPCNIEDYPYQVSVVHKDSHICGGSLITTSHVLTAAHCTRNYAPKDLLVRAGSSIINEGGVLKQVVKIIQHDLFDAETYDYDIAILNVSEPFETSSKIQTVRLPNPDDDVPKGTVGTATGWGRLADHGPMATQLRKVDLPVLTAETCELVYGNNVTERMLCAGYPEGGKDTCQGDSGGPLVSSGVQIGITSWGESCGDSNTPGIYTKLSKFIEYINPAMHN